MRWLYLHGFASGPGSTKGVAVAEHVRRTRDVLVERLDLRVPSFAHLRGSTMIEHVEQTLGGQPGLLIGSSLGGWAALRVAERNPNVRAVVLLAPAIGLAHAWKARLPNAVEGWRRTGWLPVADHALGGISRVDIGFLDDIDAVDAMGDPQVSAPVLLIHGRQDEVLPIDGSRRWASGRANVRMIEVDDGHQLTDSIPTILTDIDAFVDSLAHDATSTLPPAPHARP